jgi:putative endonuclease
MVTFSRSTPTRAASRGVRAEALAAAYLTDNGLTVIARNFRTRFGEIDLIARDGDTLVFVEVRLRQSHAFGGAAGSITASKRARLVAAASVYLAETPREPPCRFDAILLDAVASNRIEWQRNIFPDG